MAVSFTDNSKQVLSEFDNAVERGLESIGQTAEGYAKDDCPVDTGRLRNSITYKTASSQGTPNDRPKEHAKPSDYSPHGNAEKGAIYIGTNVEYAEAVEYSDKPEHETGKAHFLRDSATQHGEHYGKIMEASLKASGGV